MSKLLPSKLTEEQRLRAVQLHATFHDSVSIAKKLKAEFGVTLTPAGIRAMVDAKRWQPLIAKGRQVWMNQVVEFPLAHKRGRVEKLSEIFEEALTDASIPPWRKRAQLLEILGCLRQEMDEAKTQFTSITFNQINSYSDDDLMQRRDEVLRLIKDIGGTNALGHGQQSIEAANREIDVAGEQAGNGTTGREPSESRDQPREHEALTRG